MLIICCDQEKEEEHEGDRLVIDEPTSSEQPASKKAASINNKSNPDDMDDEDVPECQGCHRNQAQFVCAGCGNQWYCSRECQVQLFPFNNKKNAKVRI